MLLTKKAAKLEGCAKSSLTGYVALCTLDLGEHIEAADALGFALKVRGTVSKSLVMAVAVEQENDGPVTKKKYYECIWIFG